MQTQEPKKQKGLVGFIKRRPIVSGIILFVIVMIFVVDSEKKTGQTPASAEPVKEQPLSVPEVSVTADEIVSDYVANEVAADKKYKGKIIEVTGTVTDIKKDITDAIYVNLEAESDFMRSVQCFFDDEQLAAQLKKGQRVTMIGECNGLMMNVLVYDCRLK